VDDTGKGYYSDTVVSLRQGLTLPNDFLSKIEAASNVLTFRDLILLPGRSRAEPSEIDLTSRISTNIRLSLPLVSSPMDTVTEWRLALEMARLGGVGVIHRNMSVERQVEQVKKVKSSKAEASSADPKGRPLVGAAISPLARDRCVAVARAAA
jgi:IMP dehydrogenase/GMP reductase